LHHSREHRRSVTRPYTLGHVSTEPSAELPTIVLSSVVRSTHKGESHGGAYLVDLATDAIEQVLDWSDSSIDWEGRGGDRGLRGIAFHGGNVYLAASDEIFIFDREFRRQGSFSSPYLRHCHEICVHGESLFMASTGFDSVLEYDLNSHRFVRGYCLRFREFWRIRRKLNLRPRPTFIVFDPDRPGGPSQGDTCHVNNAFVQDGDLCVSGTGLGNIWRVRGDRLDRYAHVPYGSHNARSFKDGVLLNHTRTDRIAFLGRRGRLRAEFPLPTYPKSRLLNSELPNDLARQAFGRGLTVVNDSLVIGGSSPATVTAYRFDPPEVLKSVNVSLDVRNAVHGLEVWPFDRFA